jgi:hypothetical protein
MAANRRTNVEIAVALFSAVVDGPFTLAGLIENGAISGTEKYKTAFKWVEGMYQSGLIHIAEWRPLPPQAWRCAWVPTRNARGRRRVVEGRWEPVYAFGAGEDALLPAN